ncbi:carboxymuconolactone decarboxylase family protein [Mucilaginibacter sp. BT774]|uniref:carboxymuconolactone decarboxylase family protein n=1 Tax=Mucilaginibacter sp. BT774 TaxID=3062276 RepID=UPI00267444CD|nr:carboxymuconolactone decarboxylase family protein [Mucilaginibacter sp. BT774]MDO3625293.1 carboxymuconolactone decarboxylase family protein [Mucilaginibacter sp. BT774]
MKSFTVPTYDQVADNAQPAFDRFIKIMGRMPNLYATIGYSANALNSYLAYVSEQARGNFHAKEREAVYLIVSQLNGCEYCLASHTQSAIKNGWTEQETLSLRAGNHPDKKWQIIYRVIKSVIDNKGQVSDDLLDEFYALGYQEAAIIDLLVLINVMSFTNYAFRLMQIPIDFPLAKDIA